MLAGSRMIVELPVGDPDDQLAAGEVLVQEGLATWVVPFERRAELVRLRELFGRRVRLGVSDLRTPGQVATRGDPSGGITARSPPGSRRVRGSTRCRAVGGRRAARSRRRAGWCAA